jgi:hypothetical protein
MFPRVNAAAATAADPSRFTGGTGLTGLGVQHRCWRNDRASRLSHPAPRDEEAEFSDLFNPPKQVVLVVFVGRRRPTEARELAARERYRADVALAAVRRQAAVVHERVAGDRATSGTTRLGARAEPAPRQPSLRVQGDAISFGRTDEEVNEFADSAFSGGWLIEWAARPNAVAVAAAVPLFHHMGTVVRSCALDPWQRRRFRPVGTVTP